MNRTTFDSSSGSGTGSYVCTTQPLVGAARNRLPAELRWMQFLPITESIVATSADVDPDLAAFHFWQKTVSWRLDAGQTPVSGNYCCSSDIDPQLLKQPWTFDHFMQAFLAKQRRQLREQEDAATKGCSRSMCGSSSVKGGQGLLIESAANENRTNKQEDRLFLSGFSNTSNLGMTPEEYQRITQRQQKLKIIHDLIHDKKKQWGPDDLKQTFDQTLNLQSEASEDLKRYQGNLQTVKGIKDQIFKKIDRAISEIETKVKNTSDSTVSKATQKLELTPDQLAEIQNSLGTQLQALYQSILDNSIGPAYKNWIAGIDKFLGQQQTITSDKLMTYLATQTTELKTQFKSYESSILSTIGQIKSTLSKIDETQQKLSTLNDSIDALVQTATTANTELTQQKTTLHNAMSQFQDKLDDPELTTALNQVKEKSDELKDASEKASSAADEMKDSATKTTSVTKSLKDFQKEINELKQLKERFKEEQAEKEKHDQIKQKALIEKSLQTIKSIDEVLTKADVQGSSRNVLNAHSEHSEKRGYLLDHPSTDQRMASTETDLEYYKTEYKSLKDKISEYNTDYHKDQTKILQLETQIENLKSLFVERLETIISSLQTNSEALIALNSTCSSFKSDTASIKQYVTQLVGDLKATHQERKKELNYTKAENYFRLVEQALKLAERNEALLIQTGHSVNSTTQNQSQSLPEARVLASYQKCFDRSAAFTTYQRHTASPPSFDRSGFETRLQYAFRSVCGTMGQQFALDPNDFPGVCGDEPLSKHLETQTVPPSILAKIMCETTRHCARGGTAASGSNGSSFQDAFLWQTVSKLAAEL